MTSMHRPPFPRLFVVLPFLALLLLAACGAISPDAAKPQTFKVGLISGGTNMDTILAGFKAGMVEAGYVEGKTLNYVYDGPAASLDKLESMAQNVLSAKVDVIVSLGTSATKAVQKVTANSSVPVVFVPITDPVKSGFVQSLKNPGGNMTGVTVPVAVTAQRLEWLQKVAPNAKRIFCPYDPGDEAATISLQAVKEAASKLGLELITPEVRTSDEVATIIAQMPDDADAIFILPGSVIGTKLSDFVNASLQRKIPLSAPMLNQINSGALVSYSFSATAIGKQAVRLVDRVLKGAKPADLPVENAETVLGINLKTANAIGLNISDDILRQAATIVR